MKSRIHFYTIAVLLFVIAIISVPVTAFATDDHGDDRETATPITFNTLISGEIGETGDVDYFSFEAEEGAYYELSDTTVTSEGDIMVLFVHDIGSIYFPTEFNWYFVIGGVWLSPVTDTRYISVYCHNSSCTGSYSFTLSPTVVVDDHYNYQTYATPVTVDSAPVGGDLQYDADRDFFRFETVEDTVYDLDVNVSDELGFAHYNVYREISGGIYKIGYLGSAADTPAFPWRSIDTGVYYVSIFGNACGDFTTGPFEFSVSTTYIEDDHSNYYPGATPVTVDSQATDGEINFGADHDYFSFEAEEGETYYLYTELKTLSQTAMYLFDSDGVTVIDYDTPDRYSARSSIMWTCTVPGTYYINVTAFSEFIMGTYTLSISTKLFEDDHGNDCSTATPVLINAQMDGEINCNDDLDYFSFGAVAGSVYKIEDTLYTLPGSIVTLFENDCSTVIALDENGTFECQASNTYYVEVKGATYDDLGTYSLLVSQVSEDPCPGDDHGDDYTQATPVIIDVPMAGEINCYYDLDYFSFNAQEGSSYHITAELYSLPGATVTLFDTDGTTIIPLGVNDKFECGVSGTYYVEVKGYQGVDLGTYKLLVKYTCCDHGNSEGGGGNLGGDVAAASTGGGGGCFIATASYEYKKEPAVIEKIMDMVIDLLR